MKLKFDYNGKYKKIYYKTTSEGNRGFKSGKFFKYITQYLNKTDKLCEFGCGDGSKLIHLKEYVKEVSGFDISEEAIRKSKKLIPDGKFYVADSGKIFKDRQFDVTVCLYTLEHVSNPKEFIDEMIRVTKKKGYVIGLCPNFGSPLFPSPPEIIDRNFIQRVILVLSRLKNYRRLYCKKIYKNVNPITDRDWKPDYDTLAEVSLEKVVQKYKGKIIYANSFWSVRPYLYFPIAVLSFLQLKPFKYWGFNCFFVIQK